MSMNWPALDWWKERGYLPQDGYVQKVLPNKCDICISCNDEIPTAPPTDGRTYDIGMYEPDGTISVVTFSMNRAARVDPLRMLAALLKACEDEMIA